MCAIELSEDLKRAVSKPFVLWHAGDAPWVVNLEWGPHEKNYVTDGPYLLSVGNELLALWSSFDKDGYVEAMARSDNGLITGQWTIIDEVLFAGDCGHGMVFETFEGKHMFVCHSPNTPFDERPCFKEISIEKLGVR